MPSVVQEMADEPPLTNGVVSDPMEPASVLPIAVIGLAGRFPGEATDAKALWDMCCEGRSAWSDIPEDRFSSQAYRHPNPSKTGCFNPKGAHFLQDDVGLFDAAFFGISAVEAKAMDPQQRLLLEATYEAMESAGITPESIAGHSTGVYVGASQVDYAALLQRDPHDMPIYQSTGASANTLSNRISYIFDLKGPSFTMDTACSSSLVALHTACQSIRIGEIDQAIVCGAHIMLSPETMIGLSMLRLFGDDGRSYSYDSRATGYGRGEGVASLILKPLKCAVRDGDNIRAVIRNTGLNQDGKTAGITFPSCDAQANLIKAVYEEAGINPLETDYVEAHGTGTAIGDPIEAEAIARSLTKNRPIGRPLIVGSVKSNIGHLEPASGLAAMVKTIMALQEGVIPPNVDFQAPNKDIPMDEWNIMVPTSTQAWPNPDIQRASISNFGFGGTNAHVILEKYNEPDLSPTLQGRDRPYLNGDTVPVTPIYLNTDSHDYQNAAWFAPKSQRLTTNTHSAKRRLYVLSANDKASLRKRTKQLATYLEEHTDVDLELLARTLNERRSQLQWREAVSAVTSSDLVETLKNEDAEYAKPSGKTKLGFIFTGQGAQWANMGMELLVYPAFAQTLHEANRILKILGADWSLLDELMKDTESSRISQPSLSQPTTTAVQIALVDLLSTWGIIPNAVVGHSSGEIAAAYAAGALSLADCMLIAYRRGCFAESLKKIRPDRPGGMLAIGASPTNVRPMLQRLGSAHAVIACVNAPTLVTASGDERAIARLQTDAEDKGLFNRRLKVDVAYHSPHMEDVATEYLESLSSITPRAQTQVKFYSSVKGSSADTSTLNASYWVENMILPVQFLDGVQSMYSQVQGPDVLVEIGPHSALEAPLKDIMKANPRWSKEIKYLPTLIRNKDATMTALSLARSLHVLGAHVDISAINQIDTNSLFKPIFDLPAYPWNHSKRYWHESRLSVNHRQQKFPRNDLLGLLVDDFNIEEPRWRNILRLTDLPWLLDHKVQGTIIYPFAGYLTMALEAVFQYAMLHEQAITDSTSYRLREVQVSRSIILTEECPTEISFVLRAQDQGTRNPSKSWLTFTVSSWTADNGWAENCRGLIQLIQEDEGLNPINGSRSLNLQRQQYESIISTYQAKCQTILDPVRIYSRFSSGGLEFGPAFRNITSAHLTLDHCIGTVIVPETAKDMPYEEETIFSMHPRTFDAFIQVFDLATDEKHLSSSDIHVPIFVKEMTVKHRLLPKPGQKLQVYAQKLRPFVDNDAETHGSLIAVCSENPSDVLIDVQELVGSRLPTMSIAQSAERNLCYQMDWFPCTDLLSHEQFATAFHLPDSDPLPQLRKLEQGAFYCIERLLQAIPLEEIDAYSPHFRKFYAVVGSQYAKFQNDDLSYQTKEWQKYSEEEKEGFLADLANMDDCGRLLCAIGTNLVPIMEEGIEPLSIMGHNDKLEKYYRGFDVMQRSIDIAANVISNLANLDPNMRILEIGGGTGAATSSILQALGSRFASYHFTDLSPDGFDNAKENCSEWSDKMKYTKFDIGKDALSQGIELASYDLVFASGVLHETANMAVTMGNVRSLLRSGGKVLFAEPTANLLSATVIFGLLPAWWCGEETERQDGPCLNEAQWHNVLERSGFSGIDGSVQVIPGGPGSASVILSTAVPEQSTAYPTAAVLTCGHSEDRLGQLVSEGLRTVTKQSHVTTDLLQVDLTDQYGVVLALEEPFWSEITEDGLKSMQKICASARGLLWVTRGAGAVNPGRSMVSGVVRTIRAEIAGLRLVTLDLDDQQSRSEAQTVDTILKVFKHTFMLDDCQRLPDDLEFAEIDGLLKVPRALPAREKDQYVVRETCGPVPEPQPFHQPDRSLTLKIGQIGLLDSIHFVDNDQDASPLEANEVEIAVAAVGMNFIDIMMSLGQIPLSRKPGQECSGTISALGKEVQSLAVGDRVCALSPGSYGNFVRTSQHWAVKLPHDMSFAHAASIPVIFCTAYYALMDIAKLSKGESVLIHAAAGGVGQAAIMLAKQAEAEIYVTVGSSDKKRLMLEDYGISEDRIMSSRNTSFHRELMAMTGNRGVDVVLNSTSGDILQQSWQCLAPLGRFLEIGKRDFVQNSNLEMNKFLESVTFAGVDLGVFALNRPPAFQKMLSEMVDLHSRKVLEPIKPLNVFPISKLEQAMRTMQTGKHVGKIIIDCSEENIVQALPATSPKAVNDPDSSYLITGGTGGIGKSITRWLAREGAKNIILASRSGSDGKGVSELVEELQAIGVKVFVDRCDVADLAQVKSLVIKCQEIMPPIRGVIHGAMALRDALFETISYEDWSTNIKPRIQGAWNLHDALQTADQDFFVMLSSVSGIVGNPGQSAYAASNTFLDSFAAYRNSLGLPASSIDIGLVAGVGYAAEHMAANPDIATTAHDQLSEAELLAVVKAAITNPIPGTDFTHTVTGLKLLPGKPVPAWALDAKFVHVLHTYNATTSPAVDTSGSNLNTTRTLIRQADSMDAAVQIICDALSQRLSSLLMIAVEDVNVKKPVVAYGLDSLAAVELRNWITSGLEATVPLIELMNSASIEGLAGKIASKSRLVNSELLVTVDGEGDGDEKVAEDDGGKGSE